MKSLIDMLGNVVAGCSRIAILGVGNELMGDDGVGIIAARRLSAIINKPCILVLECGVAPEAFTSIILRFQPDLILILDAVDFGGSPGSVSLLNISSLDRVSISTHKPSLTIMAKYLEMNGLKARILVLAIQPQFIGFNVGLSDKVEESVNFILRYLVEILDSI